MYIPVVKFALSILKVNFGLEKNMTKFLKSILTIYIKMCIIDDFENGIVYKLFEL